MKTNAIDSHVFLIGFMAAGKSTVGPAVAGELGLEFRDLDLEIAEMTGSISSQFLKQQGEEEFRQKERLALETVCFKSRAVVATGGGTPCFFDNLEVMRQQGVVINLATSLETCMSRARASLDERPLLHRDPAEVKELFTKRRPVYRRAHGTVNAENSADSVTKAIERVAYLSAWARKKSSHYTVVSVGEGYPIIVKRGALGLFAGWLEEILDKPPSRVAVVFDGNVAAHAQAAQQSLIDAGFAVSTHRVTPGEQSKSFGEMARLCDELVVAGLDRSSLIVAIGGGVVGDLAGYVAASLFRGIALVHVPTTWLAMVDSAIGGKTGINSASGKNLVGAFWQPRMVVIDPELSATLPLAEKRACLGELLKYALLDGSELWTQVDELADNLAEPDTSLLQKVIVRCATIKAAIVSRDPLEQAGERVLLNLGHTIGHAIEAATGYDGSVRHGEAVAMGLVAATRLGVVLGKTPPEVHELVSGAVKHMGLADTFTQWMRPEVLSYIGTDKKREKAYITEPLPIRPGVVETEQISAQNMQQILLDTDWV